MRTFRDNIFLGIASDNVGINSGYCFDVLHKFFDEQILINDYLNHQDIPEIKEVVDKITHMYDIRYQYTTEILNGCLIDYKSLFARSLENKHGDGQWNEVYLSTLKKNKLENVGWRKANRRTWDAYCWKWPERCSYVGLMNVTVSDERGYEHDIDVDPRDYLLMLGKKISLPKKKGE